MQIYNMNRSQVLKLLGKPEFTETLNNIKILFYSKQKDGFVTGKHGDIFIRNVLVDGTGRVFRIVSTSSYFGDFNSLIKNAGYY